MGHYLIVGGSGGIGASLVKRLVDQHEVTVMSRDPDLAVQGGRSITADVTKDELPSISGPLDGIVYCPGSITLKPFRALDPEDFRSDYEVNVIGATRTLSAYLRNLRSAPQASVVLFSTVAVQTGMPNHASIAAAKGAVEGLTRSLAAEWAPKIRVNAIAPSLTQTPLSARLLRTEEMVAAAGARHPLGRIGTPDELAAQAEFLLGPDSAWVSGQVLAVDGGMSALRRF